MRIPRLLASSVLAAVLATGCASAGGGRPRNDEPVPGAEVADYTNLHLALQQLRPSWLQRANEVFMDSQYAGSVGILRRMVDEPIQWIELVPSRDVVRRFGPCQAPAGTGTVQRRDPQCGTRPAIHIVRYGGG